MTNSEYEREIRSKGWPALTEAWNLIVRGAELDGWALGKTFEYLIIRALELSGLEVRWPFSVNLDGDEVEQLDGGVELPGLGFFLVESKDRAKPLNIEPIYKLRGILERRPRTVYGMVFSTSDYTRPAQIVVNYGVKNILLWFRDDIQQCMDAKDFKALLKRKFEHMVYNGICDYTEAGGM